MLSKEKLRKRYIYKRKKQYFETKENCFKPLINFITRKQIKKGVPNGSQKNSTWIPNGSQIGSQKGPKNLTNYVHNGTQIDPTRRPKGSQTVQNHMKSCRSNQKLCLHNVR